MMPWSVRCSMIMLTNSIWAAVAAERKSAKVFGDGGAVRADEGADEAAEGLA
jgi:hypothetical protein